ncbi:MAG: phosphate transport system permease protein [Gaiellales bacterium]|nr:phosphate transport system permease protein [Gaiellales bacterium]
MEHAPAPEVLIAPQPASDDLRRRLRLSDLSLHGASLAGAAIAVALLVGIVWKVVDLARPAISKFGLGFITDSSWNPVTNKYGAWDFLVGTLISSVGALVIAGPLAVGIAIYLTELSPRWVRQPLAILVELLAAIPSVVLGLWGILVLGPFVHTHLEPWLNGALGWIPLFSGDASPVGMLPAILILALMMLPIITSISREVLLTAPRDMRDGALALGVTRWEMIRGIVLPYARPGIAAAMMLGLARALGEAIAVTQVIGSATGIHVGLFGPADTLASRIASQYQGAASDIQVAAIAYLAVILLVIALAVNVSARVIVATSVRRAAR